MADAADLADRYSIERELGEGGMATVYLAEDLKHQRQVAIKVLNPELAAVLGAERFTQEITTTAQHRHTIGGLPKADGRQLFFEAPDGGIMIASITPGADFQVAAPQLLFRAPGWTRSLFFDSGTPYDVSPDRQRFIVRQAASTTDAVLVQNWPARLEAKGGW